MHDVMRQVYKHTSPTGEEVYIQIDISVPIPHVPTTYAGTVLEEHYEKIKAYLTCVPIDYERITDATRHPPL